MNPLEAHEPPDWRVGLFQVLPLGAVAWGALAFGSVYAWAYWPLAALCVLTGVAGLTLHPGIKGAAPSLALSAGLAAMGAAMVAQLVPLPSGVVAAVSPKTIALLSNLNPAFQAGLMQHHPLSVWPRDTVVALALFGSLVLLCAGATRLFSICGSRRFVEGLTALTVVMALVGIVQSSLTTTAIYGWWTVPPGSFPFGPFVNRNHFAGWMVMALPLTLALLVAGIDRGMRGVRPGWRDRLLWFSSPEASRLVLVAASALLGGLSLMLTMSRSGITAFVLAVMMTGWFALRTIRGRTRKLVAAVSLLVLVGLVLVWTGPEVIAQRFAAADWGEFENRKGAWTDAWSVIRDFPILGTGLNTYWAAALFYQRHEMAYFFGQAHNDYLQLAAEGGLLLIVPALVSVAVFVRDARRAMRESYDRTTQWLRAGAVTSLVAILFQETVDFSLQMPGNAALFAVLCAIALHRPAGASDGRGLAIERSKHGVAGSTTASGHHAVVVLHHPRHGRVARNHEEHGRRLVPRPHPFAGEDDAGRTGGLDGEESDVIGGEPLQ